MNELLKKLLEAEILTAEAKTQLEEAFDSQMADVVASTRASTEEAVRLELAEQWLETRDTLIEAIDQKVTDMLAEEVAELKSDIAAFRDLEVEYAEKLAEAKNVMGAQVKEDLSHLIKELDTFLEAQIVAEFNELKDDLMEAKKVQFGRTMFEAFANEYQTKFVDESEVAKKLAEAEQSLLAVTAKLNETTSTKLKMERTLKLESLLAPLSGNPRQLMETILSSVDTKDLDKAYSKFIGRVLKEDATKTDAPLTEGTKEDKVVSPTVVKTGDIITENVNSNTAETVVSVEEKRKLQRMAGIAD
jgi:hypothetical protein